MVAISKVGETLASVGASGGKEGRKDRPRGEAAEDERDEETYLYGGYRSHRIVE